MTTLPIAQSLHRSGHWSNAVGHVELNYDARFIRRKRLTTSDGQPFIVDLEKTTSLDHGDALELNDGRLIEVKAAEEALFEVTGPDLVRLAWHVGNRHTPCQLGTDRLLIMADPVIGHMLEHLGATVTEITAPFTPEGGAYGHGRTHSHEHVATAHEH